MMNTKFLRFSGKALLALGLLGVSASVFASQPSDFSQLTKNVSNLELSILTIVQVVVTLAGILLAFRGVIHLKQHAHGSPQEKHLPKGIANIIFAALLFMVVPLIHMFVGTLSNNVGGGSYNAWDASGADNAGSLNSGGATPT